MSKKDKDGNIANVNTLDDDDAPKIKYNNDIRELRTVK